MRQRAKRPPYMGLKTMKRLSPLLLLPLLAAFVTKPGAETEEPSPPIEVSATLAASGVITSEVEQLFFSGLEKMLDQRTEEAMADLALLQEKNPDFRLANLIYADLMRSRAAPLRRFGGKPQGRYEKAQVQEMLEEAQTRAKYLQHGTPPVGSIPEPLLNISNLYPHVILVDMSLSRLYTFRNDGGTPKLLTDYYISIGKNGAGKEVEGDKKTPIGLYFITGNLPGDQLPAYYGSGALPLNYPNEWDLLHRKTGSGIWLHGTPIYTYSRPPKSSEGCVALTNPDFEALQQIVGVGTPVLINNALQWLDEATWQQRRETILAELEHWRQDWQSRDADRALGHYAKDFHNLEADLTTWSHAVRERFAAGAPAEVNFSDINVFGYPAEVPMVMVTFSQHNAQSSEQRAQRRQYWRQEQNAGWKIVYEDEG